MTFFGQKWTKLTKMAVFEQKWAFSAKNDQKWAKIVKIDQNRRKSRISRNFQKSRFLMKMEIFIIKKIKKLKISNFLKKSKFPEIREFFLTKIRISQCFLISNPIFLPGRAEKNWPKIDDNFLVPAANPPRMFSRRSSTHPSGTPVLSHASRVIGRPSKPKHGFHGSRRLHKA